MGILVLYLVPENTNCKMKSKREAVLKSIITYLIFSSSECAKSTILVDVLWIIFDIL